MKTLHIQLSFSSDFKVSVKFIYSEKATKYMNFKAYVFKFAIWNDKHSQVEFDLCGLKFVEMEKAMHFKFNLGVLIFSKSQLKI